MRNLNRNIIRAARDVVADPSSSFRFESLEARQLMSVSSPSPTDNLDYHFVLSTPTGTTAVRTSTQSIAPRTPAPGGFKWYDGTGPQYLSSTANSGVLPATLDGFNMWPLLDSSHADRSGGFDETRTRAMARNAAATTNLLILDVESIPLDIRSSTPAQIDAGIARFRQMIGWVRDERPQLKVAIYGFLSLSEQYASTNYLAYSSAAAAGVDPWYNASVPVASAQYADWQAASSYLTPISQMVDYVMPSIYTASASQDSWLAYAKSTITDSRRFGKPVIPFIWPQYHSSIPVLGGQFLDPAMWQLQLDTVRSLADGAIIWLDGGTSYDPSQAWVSATITKANADLHTGGGSSNSSNSTQVQTDPIVDPMNQSSGQSSQSNISSSSTSFMPASIASPAVHLLDDLSASNQRTADDVLTISSFTTL